MIEQAPVIPLNYDAGPRRGDSVFAIVGIALSMLCCALPIFMAWQLFTGRRHAWPVYTPYAASVGFINVGINWPWYALDTVALLASVVGLQRGRPRLAVVGIILSVAAMTTVLTLVLGSPWSG